MSTRKSKYKNKKTTAYGITFDSVAEATVYGYLLTLKKSKLIDKIERQVRFELQEKFRFEGKNIRAIEYVCDFLVTRGDTTDIIDVKGMETQMFKMKRKMFQYRYNKDIITVKSINDYLLHIKGLK